MQDLELYVYSIMEKKNKFYKIKRTSIEIDVLLLLLLIIYCIIYSAVLIFASCSSETLPNFFFKKKDTAIIVAIEIGVMIYHTGKNPAIKKNTNDTEIDTKAYGA